jgi:DDE_Tnp_1-associated
MKGPRAAHGYRDTIDDLTKQPFSDLPVNDQERLLGALVGGFTHFFGDFTQLFREVADRRSPKKITYALADLAFVGVLMFLCHVGARRQIRLQLHTRLSAVTFKTLFGVETIPHGDTLNDAFKLCDPEDFQRVVCRMDRMLIRKKVLNFCRCLDRYFVVAVDGTGTVTFSERHCPHCLTQTQNGKTVYYHKVLEAKIVGPNGFAFSLMSEFIENPGEKPKKQDCELKAFYRLAPRLKAAFPRLPILLTLDGLYAGGPVFRLCTRYDWKFMIVLTDKDLPSINQEFQALSVLQSENRRSLRTGNKREIGQEFRWADQILYTDSEKREHTLHVVECIETKPDTQGRASRSTWKWITNVRVSKANVIALANDGGRRRWKIENQGFNAQKTGGYRLEHAYTTDSNAAKIFYYVLQIAHTIAQLLYNGSLLGRAGRRALGALKNLACRLLEAWRNAPLTKDALQHLTHWRFQIRFCPDTS